MRKLLTLAQLAKATGLSRSTIYRLRARHDLPCIMIGRSLRIDAEEAKAWIASRRAKGANLR